MANNSGLTQDTQRPAPVMHRIKSNQAWASNTQQSLVEIQKDLNAIQKATVANPSGIPAPLLQKLKSTIEKIQQPLVTRAANARPTSKSYQSTVDPTQGLGFIPYTQSTLPNKLIPSAPQPTSSRINEEDQVKSRIPKPSPFPNSEQ